MFDLIAVSIFMLVSLAFIVISCVMKNGLTRNCTVAVEAVIENDELHHSYSRNHIYHVPVYSYYFNGVLYHATAKSRRGIRGLGAKQILYINPYNPQQCYKKEDLSLSRVLFWIGLLLFMISMIILLQIIIGLLH